MFVGNAGHRYVRAVAAGALILCVGVLAGCGSKDVRAAGSAPPPLVTVATLEPKNVPIYADFAAQTFARDTVDVRGRVTGYIEKWLFKPGAQVQAGQVLYVLARRPYEASLTEAQGQLRTSEADL